MDEIMTMIVSALGAAAGAAALLLILGSGLGLIGKVIGGAASLAINLAPTAACVGGALYVASRTGYGGLRE